VFGNRTDAGDTVHLQPRWLKERLRRATFFYFWLAKRSQNFSLWSKKFYFWLAETSLLNKKKNCDFLWFRYAFSKAAREQRNCCRVRVCFWIQVENEIGSWNRRFLQSAFFNEACLSLITCFSHFFVFPAISFYEASDVSPRVRCDGPCCLLSLRFRMMKETRFCFVCWRLVESWDSFWMKPLRMFNRVCKRNYHSNAPRHRRRIDQNDDWKSMNALLCVCWRPWSTSSHPRHLMCENLRQTR
jgi:hypothetical protein